MLLWGRSKVAARLVRDVVIFTLCSCFVYKKPAYKGLSGPPLCGAVLKASAFSQIRHTYEIRTQGPRPGVATVLP
jgi:hypothetical protein